MSAEKRNRVWSQILGSVFALIFLFFFFRLGYDVGSVVILAIGNVMYILCCFLLINAKVPVEFQARAARWVIYVVFAIVFLVLYAKMSLIGNIFLWTSALIPLLCYPRLINIQQFAMIGLWYAAFAAMYPVVWLVAYGLILFMRLIQVLTTSSLGRDA